jgi:hypothetical protein
VKEDVMSFVDDLMGMIPEGEIRCKELRRRLAEIQPVPQKRSDANGEDYFDLKEELDKESERVRLVEQKLRNVGRWPAQVE